MINEFIFIIIDFVLGSLTAFFGILTYGKTKNISYLLFVITSLFLYLSMIFRILETTHIFILSEYTFNSVPVYQYAVNYFPQLFLLIGFIILLREK